MCSVLSWWGREKIPIVAVEVHGHYFTLVKHLGYNSNLSPLRSEVAFERPLCFMSIGSNEEELHLECVLPNRDGGFTTHCRSQGSLSTVTKEIR